MGGREHGVVESGKGTWCGGGWRVRRERSVIGGESGKEGGMVGGGGEGGVVGWGEGTWCGGEWEGNMVW